MSATAGLRVARAGAAARDPALAKRKAALVFGYVGTGYRGLMGDRAEDGAVEYPVRLALAASGRVSAANAESLSKVRWSRSSRTDAGVHAAGLVASLKLLVRRDDELGARGSLGAVVDDVNRHLPDEVRVFSARLVGKHFCARSWMQCRAYEYLVPASALPGGASDAECETMRRYFSAFLGHRSVHNFTARLGQKLGRKRGGAGDGAGGGAGCDLRELEAPFAADLHEHRREVQATRCLLSFGVDRVEAGGVPFMRVSLVGESFVYHQIRKMIGLAVAVARGAAPGCDEALAAALSPMDVRVPVAPPGYLILDAPHRTAYARAWREEGAAPLELDGDEMAALCRFKEQQLYPHVAAHALSPDGGGALREWLAHVDEWGRDYARAEIPRLARLAAEHAAATRPFEEERKKRKAFFAERKERERQHAAAGRAASK